MLSAYNQQLSDLVQDFINSYDPFLEEPEHLLTVSDLEAFLNAHGFHISETPGNAELLKVREMREELRAIWNAGEPEIMRESLNELLREAHFSVSLGEDLQWTFDVSENFGLLHALQIKAVLGLILSLQEHGHERLRACASSPCQDVFIDTSRNKSRRFCSERCANRYNVAAFRERQKDE